MALATPEFPDLSDKRGDEYYAAAFEAALGLALSDDEIVMTAAAEEIDRDTLASEIEYEATITELSLEREELERLEASVMVEEAQGPPAGISTQSPSEAARRGWRRLTDWFKALVGELRRVLLRSPPPAPREKVPPPPPPRKGPPRPRARTKQAVAADAARAEHAAARLRFQALLYQRILRLLRAGLVNRVEDSYSTVLRVSPANAPGLAELSGNEDYDVVTTAECRLAALLKRMPGGSIGVSGPRGVGKTTLIARFCRPPNKRTDRPLLKAVVSAPTRYDGREFLLHMLESLCEDAIGGPAMREESRARSRMGRGPSGETTLTRVVVPLLGALVSAGAMLIAAALTGAHVHGALLAGGACVVGAVAALGYSSAAAMRWVRVLAAALAAIGVSLIVLSATGVHYDALFGWGAGALVGAVGILIATRMVIGGWVPVEYMSDDDLEVFGLRSAAHAMLDKIEYQQTVTTGWSAGVKTSVGVEGGLSGSRALAQVPLTFPQVVALVRNFLALVGTHADVIVGIDELDKMESEETANRFLNDIKGIFGIRGCFFLVSVSEEAMSNFERRGARIRDVFDSSFDEILHVGALTFSESRQLLAQRVTGLPIPFVALCHVLAGGLPRDVIRIARAMVSLTPEGLDGRLSSIAGDLVRLELAARARAVMVAARALDLEPQTSAFLAWADSLRGMSMDAGSLRAACAALPEVALLPNGGSAVGTGDGPGHEDDDDREQAQQLLGLSLEVAAFCYFAAVMLEFFVDGLEKRRLKAALEDTGARSLDGAAGARQMLSLNGRFGWRLVSAFRAAWKLGDGDVPFPSLNGSVAAGFADSAPSGETRQARLR